MDAATLSRTIQAEYAHLEALIAPMSDTQLSTPSSEEHYQDHAQHIRHLLDASQSA